MNFVNRRCKSDNCYSYKNIFADKKSIVTRSLHLMQNGILLLSAKIIKPFYEV